MRGDSRRKRYKRPLEEGAPAWMTTYSDMITLVLAFFVLLFSFAVIDEARFNELLSSLRITFLGSEGILRGSIDPADLPDSFFQDYEELELELEDPLETLEIIHQFIEENGLEDTIHVFVDDRGIVLEISDALLFDSAKADLEIEAIEILSYVADLLGDLQNKVVVEGHTDDVPINTLLFPSNWELSVARAVTVVRFLVEEKGLDPPRFSAMGYGEYHPVAGNSTAEGRAKNRRVNIVVSKIKHNDLPGGIVDETD